MTNEEAKVFLDNLKICINEHPIVADWLVEIENRNDEPQTENLFTDKYGDVWEWRGDAWYCISGDEPQTEVDWKQRLCDMYGADRKSFDEAWRKYEADKVKDEPQTEDADCDKCIWSVCNYNKAFAFEDEPQTDCNGCRHYVEATADACYECKRSYADCYEPQTERSE